MSGFLSVVRHTLSEALHRKVMLGLLVMILIDLVLTAALIGSASSRSISASAASTAGRCGASFLLFSWRIWAWAWRAALPRCFSAGWSAAVGAVFAGSFVSTAASNLSSSSLTR